MNKKRSWIVLLVLVVAGCKSSNKLQNSNINTVHSTELNHPVAATYGVNELITDLNSNQQITTLKDTLRLIPEEIRAKHTFVYDSNSSQTASDQFPRTIIFREDGGFVAAFEGDSSHGDDASLEMIEFDYKENRFDFYELNFPLKRKNGIIIRPQRSPERCKNCHQDDPRPIWDNYSKWPGVYGSNRDFYPPTTELLKTYDLVAEEANLKKFLKGNRLKGVYELLPQKTESVYSPYRDASIEDTNLHYRPNTYLGMVWKRLNARRMFRMIITSDLFTKYKYFILFATQRCDLSLLSEDQIQTLESQISGDLDRPFKLATTLINPTLRTKPSKDFSLQFLPLFNMGVHDAGLGLEPKGYFMTGGIEPGSHLADELLRFIAKDDSVLFSYLRDYPLSSAGKYAGLYGNDIMDAISTSALMGEMNKDGKYSETSACKHIVSKIF